MKNTLLCAVAIVFATIAVPAWANETFVNIKDHAYSPATINVKAGTKVTWTNRDQDPHTAVDSAKPPAFHSSALDTGDTFSYTFDKPGKYSYFCTLHPDMVGTVNVTP